MQGDAELETRDPREHDHTQRVVLRTERQHQPGNRLEGAAAGLVHTRFKCRLAIGQHMIKGLDHRLHERRRRDVAAEPLPGEIVTEIIRQPRPHQPPAITVTIAIDDRKVRQQRQDFDRVNVPSAEAWPSATCTIPVAIKVEVVRERAFRRWV